MISRRIPSVAIAIFLSAFISVAVAAEVRPADDAKVPSDTFVLKLDLPAGSRVQVGDQWYDRWQEMKWSTLLPGRIYLPPLRIDFPSGKSDRRNLLTQGGQSARLALVDPGSRRTELALQTGHMDEILSVAFSPDGRQVLTASKDETARLWDAATGKELRRFEGHTSYVCSVAFSPDGQQVLTGSKDGTARLREAATGKELRRFDGHTRPVLSVAFSPDGRQVLTGSWDRTARLWDATTGNELRRFEGHTSYVCSVAFSLDGRRVLTGSSDNTARLWEAATGKELRRFEGRTSSVLSVAFSLDGRRVLTGSSDHTARLWEAATGKELQRFEGHGGDVRSVAFSPDSRQVLTGSDDETARLWDAATGKEFRRFEGHGGDVRSVAFSPDSRQLLTGSGYHTARLWEAATGKELRQLEGAGYVTSVAFSPDSRQVLTGSHDETARLWDAVTGKELRQFEGHARYVTSVAFSPDGRQALTGSEDGTVRLWDIATGKELLRLINLIERDAWLVVTPEGLFDGSTSARQLVSYRIGDGLNVVPVDRFFQDFYYPGLMAAIWRGERPLPKLTIGKGLPPKLRIVTPRPGQADERDVAVAVEAVDQGGGVKGPWLKHNDAKVGGGATTREGNVVRLRVNVPMVHGKNTLEAVAATGDGVWESEPERIVVEYVKPVEPPQLFLVAVGINRYAEDSYQLKYAAEDAQAVARLFSERAPAMYGEGRVHVKTVQDEAATRAGIVKALEAVAQKAQPQDVLVLLLAGHGEMVSTRYYFLPHDFRRQRESTIEDDIRKTGLPQDELDDAVSRVPALKRVIVYDTCKSGGALGGRSRSGSGFAKAMEASARTQGSFLISAAAAGDEAQEVGDLRHGVLTYALLAGAGAVDHGPLARRRAAEDSRQPVLAVRGWLGFAQDNVPPLAKLYFGREQFVEFKGSGADFPILPLP